MLLRWWQVRCACVDWAHSVHVEMHGCGVAAHREGCVEVCVKAKCARHEETVHFRSCLSWPELHLLAHLEAEKGKTSHAPGVHNTTTPFHCYSYHWSASRRGCKKGTSWENPIACFIYFVPGWSPYLPTSHLMCSAFDYLMHGLFLWLE